MTPLRRIRLTDWARQQGIHYRTALRWLAAGKLPVKVISTPTGRLLVEVEPVAGEGVVLYGRVSSSDQRADLDRQMDRLRLAAAAMGFLVDREVAEIGSGLNGARKGLLRLLAEPTVGVIVVEHRDRLARFGTEYIVAALAAQGRRMVVLNQTEERLDLVQDFVDVVTSMCARIYGQRSAKNRARAAMAAAEGAA